MVLNFLKNIFSSQENQEEKNNNYETQSVSQKRDFDDAHEYNNAIIAIIDQMSVHIGNINQATTDGEYSLAESIRNNLLNDLKDYKKELENIGDYDWDSILFDAAMKYFDGIEDLMNNGYKNCIEMRVEGKRWTPEEQKVIDENNTLLQEMSHDFDDEQNTFLSFYDENGEEMDTNYVPEYFQNFNENTENNPIIQEKVHWISLKDYAAAAAFLTNGGKEEEVCKILGIELPIWHEINEIWTWKMQEDETMAIIGAYSQYFADGPNHEKFSQIWNSGDSENEFLQKIKTDEKFYYELAWARQAAYDAGMDGALWIEENFGISLGDFQSAAVKWSASGNVVKMFAYQEIKQKEYAKKFAKKNGWNIADNIKF